MSKRRTPGEVVWKVAGAGFGTRAGLGLIPPDSIEPMPCFLCDDPECNEWPDVWQVGTDGTPTGGSWSHVSECQMSEPPSGPPDVNKCLECSMIGSVACSEHGLSASLNSQAHKTCF